METPLAETLPRLRSFLSPYTGVVRNLVEFLHAPDEGRLISVGAAVADSTSITGEETVPRAGGAHWQRERAVAAALGEAVERYSASHVPEHELVEATADELGDAAVEPASFALFHERQYAEPRFPFRPFRRDTRVRWVRGTRLPDGEEAFLPAQLVYLRRAHASEPLLGYATSNGLACAATFTEAALGGLCEVVERDAFVLAWNCRLSLPRLRWHRHPELTAIDREFFAVSGLRYSAVDLSVFFGVPAVLGVVHGPPRELGALGVGAGCAPDVETAWRKAITEAFAVRRFARDTAAAEPERLGRSPVEIDSFDDHILYYADAGRARDAGFLDASAEVRDAASVEPLEGADADAWIRAITARLDRQGASAYAVDVSTPDVLAAGLAVVRVLAPQLCPLDVFHTARYLGGRRLYHAAFEAGLVPRPLDLSDVNPLPHPFP